MKKAQSSHATVDQLCSVYDESVENLRRAVAAYNRAKMRRQMRPDLEERIKQAMRYIVDNLDAPIDLRERADHVCLSRFHFHRVFQALAGETVGKVVRRQRLERVATRLRTSDALRRLYDRAAGGASYRALRCGTNVHRMIK